MFHLFSIDSNFRYTLGSYRLPRSQQVGKHGTDYLSGSRPTPAPTGPGTSISPHPGSLRRRHCGQKWRFRDLGGSIPWAGEAAHGVSADSLPAPPFVSSSS